MLSHSAAVGGALHKGMSLCRFQPMPHVKDHNKHGAKQDPCAGLRCHGDSTAPDTCRQGISQGISQSIERQIEGTGAIGHGIKGEDGERKGAGLEGDEPGIWPKSTTSRGSGMLLVKG